MKKIKKFIAFIIVSLPAVLAFVGCAQKNAGGDESTGTGGGTPFGNFISQWGIWILLAALILVFFFFTGSRRKKQMQEGQNMLDSIRPGVYVMTQGGVIGKVVEVKVMSPTEKHVVLETGSDEHKSYITYDIRAIGIVLRPDQLVPRVPAEEAVIPTDEEVQKRLEEVYSAPPDGEKTETAETPVDEIK